MNIAVSIVEDDSKVRASLCKVIDGAPGFRCVTQHPDAEGALRELPKVNPKVVLMDINLPGMSGVECLGCSADLKSAVSQNCILRTIRHTGALRILDGLPITNRRYGRLPICATSLRVAFR